MRSPLLTDRKKACLFAFLGVSRCILLVVAKVICQNQIEVFTVFRLRLYVLSKQVTFSRPYLASEPFPSILWV